MAVDDTNIKRSMLMVLILAKDASHANNLP